MPSPKRPAVRSRHVLIAGGALAAALVLAGVALHMRDRTPTTADTPVRDLRALADARIERLRSLRDEALDCMGWAAGNSFRQPGWPEVESYVGHRGLYYDAMLELVPPGLPDDLADAEAAENFQRYRWAFLRGRQIPFDAAEVSRCIVRTSEISVELQHLFDEAREPATLGSPIFPD